MNDARNARHVRLTSHLSVRSAIVGLFVLGMFAVLVFRLWSLQVLSGGHYLNAAKRNRARLIPIAAPRGDVLDRNGTVLVDSRGTLAVQINPEQLPVPVSLTNATALEHPPKRDIRVYNALARVLQAPTARLRCRLHIPRPNVFRLSPIACQVGQELTLLPYADVTVHTRTPISRDVLYYLSERQQQYPGISVREAYVTAYPHGGLAAQALGTVGPIDPGELGTGSYPGVLPGAIVGQSGLEAEYDRFLRGTDGSDRIQVNAVGQPTGRDDRSSPVAGDNLQTSLDANLQRVGQASLQQSINQNGGFGGSFVAMDPDSGAVYGLGSLPTFNPSVFTAGLSETRYRRLTSAVDGQPFLNRAIQSVGPVGSTFKPVTAIAALQSARWPLTGTYDDTGQFCIGTAAAQQCRHNASHSAYGVINLVRALKFSSDIFFYNLGTRTNANSSNSANGGPLDSWARRFGIGRAPDIDLPGAAPGTLPTPQWRADRNRLEAECDRATGPYRYTNGVSSRATRREGYHRSPTHRPGGCGIADGTNRPWSVGDNISLAIGQGDLQASPVQLALIYAALANGGTIVRPHLGENIQDRDGIVLRTIQPPPGQHVAVNSMFLEAVREGLLQAATQPGGTSYDVMGRFPQPVYGKTGTAQYIPTSGPHAGVETDYGWYACFAPASATSKPIVVVVTVEGGGFGDISAAPVARQILSQWFSGQPGPYVVGSSDDH